MADGSVARRVRRRRPARPGRARPRRHRRPRHLGPRRRRRGRRRAWSGSLADGAAPGRRSKATLRVGWPHRARRRRARRRWTSVNADRARAPRAACTADADALVPLVRNAGAVFVGPWAPAALGDYVAGVNHVLPTARTARFASALRVDTFRKHVHVVDARPRRARARRRRTSTRSPPPRASTRTRGPSTSAVRAASVEDPR